MLLDAHRNLKIADFGVARVEAQNPRDMTGETGTLGYMAPEVYVLLKTYLSSLFPSSKLSVPLPMQKQCSLKRES